MAVDPTDASRVVTGGRGLAEPSGLRADLGRNLHLGGMEERHRECQQAKQDRSQGFPFRINRNLVPPLILPSSVPGRRLAFHLIGGEGV